MADRIYVQVPAYRDPELLATLEDLVRTASEPDRLVVAVAWQHGPDEAHLASSLARLAPVRLLAIPAESSRGCNWARHVLQDGWDGEEYTLFLDSHHRFAPGWDDASIRLLEQQRAAGSARPIVTGYLPPYDPSLDPAGRTRAVYDLRVVERSEGLAYRLHGDPVGGWDHLAATSPARFVSLHFLFADGRFNRDVPIDPEIYFFADEIAIALRAFTHGYDLFRANVVLGWHLYDRTTRRTHWADHLEWSSRQQRSIARLRALYTGELAGPYGVGAQRTIADYEAFTGVPLVQRPGPIHQEVHSWSSHLARSIASSPSTARRTTCRPISSNG